MKRHLAIVVAVCVAVVLAAPALAQDADGRDARERDAREQKLAQRPPKGRKDGATAMLERLVRELKLTDQQEAPVKQILETHRAEMASWTQENGPAMRELQPILKDRQADPAKRREAMEKYRELIKTRGAISQNLLKQLADHLTEEQMAVARRLLGQRQAEAGKGGTMSLALLRQLDLTPEQQEKVQEIIAAVKKDVQQDPRAKGEAFQAAQKTIIEDVLTAEQRGKLEKLRQEGAKRKAGGGAASGMFAGLDLSDEQTKKIQELREKAVKTGGPDAKKEFYSQMMDVLTAEQRDKLEQRRRDARSKAPRDRRPEGRPIVE